MKKPTVIDLFCGAGGLSEGFRMSGYHTLLGLDSVGIFVESFKHNHRHAAAICDDIRQVSVDDIRAVTGNTTVDVVSGGPPCQGFSMAGRRDTKDPRNSLFMEFVRIVDGLKPKYIIMENVRGILSMKNAGGEPVIDIILKEFERIGYRVVPRTVLAADYGVPQKRKRVIFIGTNTGDPIEFPRQTHINPRLKKNDMLFDDGLEPWVPVKKVLLDKDNVEKNYFHSPRMIEGFLKRKEKHTSKGNGFGWQILHPTNHHIPYRQDTGRTVPMPS